MLTGEKSDDHFQTELLCATCLNKNKKQWKFNEVLEPVLSHIYQIRAGKDIYWDPKPAYKLLFYSGVISTFSSVQIILTGKKNTNPQTTH